MKVFEVIVTHSVTDRLIVGAEEEAKVTEQIKEFLDTLQQVNVLSISYKGEEADLPDILAAMQTAPETSQKVN